MTPAILVCTCMYMHFVQSTICNITFTYIIPKAYSLVTLTNGGYTNFRLQTNNGCKMSS